MKRLSQSSHEIISTFHLSVAKTQIINHLNCKTVVSIFTTQKIYSGKYVFIGFNNGFNFLWQQQRQTGYVIPVATDQTCMFRRNHSSL